VAALTRERNDVRLQIRAKYLVLADDIGYNATAPDLIADPAYPSRVLPAYQADYLHPNIAGQKAMAASIDLALVR
jgi:lysophospholipase L1-like esterase